MNSDRIFSLIKLEIAQMGSRLWWYIPIFFAVCCLLNVNSFTFMTFYGIFVLGLLGSFSASQKTMSYYMIPASAAEKIVASGIIVYVIINCLILFSGILGINVGNLARSYMFHFDFTWQWPVNCTEIFIFVIVLSALFFSNIYFKKNGVLKGLLVYIAFICLIAFTDWLILNSYFYDRSYSFPDSNMDMPQWIWYVFGVIIFLFFNFMSWLRLRETEA